MWCDGQAKKTQGPFGLTREAPHTYLTGASQQVGHSKRRTAESKELDPFFEEEEQEDKGKQRTTLKLKEKSLKGKRREEKLWRQRCLFAAGEEKTDKDWRPPKEKCLVWKCTPPWPWDHSGWRTASTEVSWKESKGEQRRSWDSFKKEWLLSEHNVHCQSDLHLLPWHSI